MSLPSSLPLGLPLVSSHQWDEMLLSSTPLIDVRAPVEFAVGSIPGSVNLPIMNNEERAEVGTTYKLSGQDLAIQKGHQLVSGKVKQDRVQAWKDFIEKNPRSVITCFRGGLRSKITQQWLLEAGIEIPRIEGGYKALRQHLMNATESFSQRPLLVISGATGSGKTLLLRSLKAVRPVCDLELLAHHRGSAFGGYAEGQPCQADFENRLGLELIRCQRSIDGRPVLIEDESRMVGRNTQPLSLFTQLRSSPVVLIEEDLQSRVQVTFDDYILQSSIGRGEEPQALEVFTGYKLALERITKKLGGLRTQEVMQDLLTAERQFLEHRELEANRLWIAKLLDWYYDPMYRASLEKRQPVVSFKGSRVECREFLLSN